MKSIPIDVLHSVICYSDETGKFTLAKNYGRRKAGSPVGSINKVNGYVELSICGEKVYGHRAAWAYFYGLNPSAAIDHINGSRSDNRIQNLRLAQHSINSENQRGPGLNNTSGLLGVSYCSQTKKWRAQIGVSRKNIKLGRFDTPELAHQAYLMAKRRLHEGCTI